MIKMVAKWVSIAVVMMATNTLFLVQDPQPEVLFRVKDKSGRTRLSAEEDGEAFRFVLYDRQGRPRLAMSTDSEDRPAITAWGRDGYRTIHIGQDVADQWRIGVGHSGGLTASMNGGSEFCGLSITSDDRVTAAIGSSVKHEESWLMVSNPADAKTPAVEARSHRSGAGLFLGRRNEYRIGLITDGEKSTMWHGERSVDGKKDGGGVRLGYDKEKGASLLLRHDNANTADVLLQCYEGMGSGLMVGAPDAARVKAGINAAGEPSVQVVGKDGTVHFEPTKK